MHVPLLDLKLQYETLRHDIQACLQELLPEQQFILGPRVARLEEEIARYCASAHAVGVNSGSDALLLALMCAGVGPGDCVITTPYTFFATVGSICRLGATPLLVDIDPETYTIDPHKLRALVDQLESSRLERLKAIMPVHLYGQCADMQPILDVARRHGLAVIEDGAQALGAAQMIGDRKQMACAIGDFGCISFFPSKNLGCFGDGGMILTGDADAAEKLFSLRMHGQGNGVYHHRYVGINGRLDALQAAVLLVKLPHLDTWAHRRRCNAEQYGRLFAEAGLNGHIAAPSVAGNNTHVYNQFVIRAERRDQLKQHLEQQGIGCAIYYPLPLHLQPCFAFLGYASGDFPESEKASRETLALPVFPELTDQQIEHVVTHISRFYTR